MLGGSAGQTPMEPLLSTTKAAVLLPYCCGRNTKLHDHHRTRPELNPGISTATWSLDFIRGNSTYDCLRSQALMKTHRTIRVSADRVKFLHPVQFPLFYQMWSILVEKPQLSGSDKRALACYSERESGSVPLAFLTAFATLLS